MTDGMHQFKLGNLMCYALRDVIFQGNVAQSFVTDDPEDEVREKVIAYGYDPDNLEVSYTCLYIDTSSEKILIDAGGGVQTEDTGQIFDRLADLGVDPTDIDIVLLSHGHGDHYMGFITEDNTLAFPNATHYVFDEEWEFYLAEDALAQVKVKEPARAEMLKTYFLPIEPNVKKFSESEFKLHENITAFACYGYTYRHLGFIIESKGEKLLYAGDAAVNCFHLLELDWGFRRDHNPEVARESRIKIREWSRDNDSPILLYHHAFPGMGKLSEVDGRWRWIDTPLTTNS